MSKHCKLLFIVLCQIFSDAFALTTPNTRVSLHSQRSAIFPQPYRKGSILMAKRRFIESKIKVPKPSKKNKDDVFDGDKEEAELARKYALANRRKNNDPNAMDPMEQNDIEWKFFDTARIHVEGGHGGNGCVAFRREKGEARGGPFGGRGGGGGSIYAVCDESINTLAPLRNRVHVRAPKASNGLGKNKNGQKGEDRLIRVPPGTLIRDFKTQKLAGELRNHGEMLLLAKGGRGGRGNWAFKSDRYTAPKIAEHGEPGWARWLNVELKLVADVGFLGMPNAGKSTLLAATSAARPKIANYPFTTIVPNLGVCDLEGDGAGLVLCDIPGLIEGASRGVGLGLAFLRHVQRCKVLLHVVDGTSDDPIGDFNAINTELLNYDSFLAKKPQVVVLNKVDITEVKEQEVELMAKLREAAGHTRVLSISAATTENTKDLMRRLKKFADAQIVEDLPSPSEIDFSKNGFERDSDDFEIESDPAYPGQFRVKGEYIEQVAKMTHWEYPEAVERFGRILDAIGIAEELEKYGAVDGDLVMVDEFDFDFAPGVTNQYIPQNLLEKEAMYENEKTADPDDGTNENTWRPFTKGGYLDEDSEELVGFNENDDWDFLDDDAFDESPEYIEGDEVWQS